MSDKDRLLGMPHGTASNRLRKTILYSMLYGKVYDRNCFQCGEEIVDVDDLSIEHRKPWQSADDPRVSFFDLDNIAFSHLRCNSRAGGFWIPPVQEICDQGHPLVGDNVSVNGKRRRCRLCYNQRQRRYRQHP